MILYIGVIAVTDYNRIVNPRLPYTHRRLLCDTEKLCDRYSKLLRIGAVGFSEQKREIPVISLGFGAKKLLAVGSIHGREYVTTGFLMRCVEDHAKAFTEKGVYGDFDLREMFSEFTLYVMPMSNPDSVEIALGRSLPKSPTRDFRAIAYKNNANNINLNANFPYMWTDVPKHRQGGEHAASERETKFLMELCEREQFERMLSFHCRGDCLYWRDGGNGEIEGDKALAEKLKSICGFSLCPFTRLAEDYGGGFENWFRHRFKKPAICVELVKYENASFDLCCRHFESYTRWDQTRFSLLTMMIP